MIHLTCPGCSARLHAKEELLGQTRKCPRCGGPVLVAEAQPLVGAAARGPAGLDEAQPDAHVHGAAETSLPLQDLPERLDRLNRYLICDKSHLVATWENNGHGWMLKTHFGMVSAARNQEQLPTQGDFWLVELKMAMTDEGLRLRGITVYQLAHRWALTTLERGDDQIVGKITGFGSLTRDQKALVREVLRDQFMRHVWEHADSVLQYLSSTDYHSPGVG